MRRRKKENRPLKTLKIGVCTIGRRRSQKRSSGAVYGVGTREIWKGGKKKLGMHYTTDVQGRQTKNGRKRGPLRNKVGESFLIVTR